MDVLKENWMREIVEKVAQKPQDNYSEAFGENVAVDQAEPNDVTSTARPPQIFTHHQNVGSLKVGGEPSVNSSIGTGPGALYSSNFSADPFPLQKFAELNSTADMDSSLFDGLTHHTSVDDLNADSDEPLKKKRDK
jgi:hypothetical protein